MGIAEKRLAMFDALLSGRGLQGLVDAAAEHYLTLEAAGGACSSVVQAIIRMWKQAIVEK